MTPLLLKFSLLYHMFVPHEYTIKHWPQASTTSVHHWSAKQKTDHHILMYSLKLELISHIVPPQILSKVCEKNAFNILPKFQKPSLFSSRFELLQTHQESPSLPSYFTCFQEWLSNIILTKNFQARVVGFKEKKQRFTITFFCWLERRCYYIWGINIHLESISSKKPSEPSDQWIGASFIMQ